MKKILICTGGTGGHIFPAISLAEYLEKKNFNVDFITCGLLILALDALVVIPFVWLRANEKPTRYAIIKIVNVCINLGFNIFMRCNHPFGFIGGTTRI